MEYVDYQKLAEQYASFLVAVGGVSITVLAVVLSLRPDSAETPKPTEGDARSYLVTALVVAALSCFVGAQMMAETAAFTNYTSPKKPTEDTSKVKPANDASTVEPIKDAVPTKSTTDKPPYVPEPTKKADRLFLLASSNIFVAIILVFFALILLPLSSGKVHRDSMKPVALLFILMVVGATYWAVLAGNFRMSAAGGWFVTVVSVLIGAAWCYLFHRLTKVSKWPYVKLKRLVRVIFKPIKKILLCLRAAFSLTERLPEGSGTDEVADNVADEAAQVKVPKVSTKPEKTFGLANFKPIEKRWQLWLAFAPSALLTIITLARFAWIYKDGTHETLLDATKSEGWIFSAYIAVSYASLIVASIRTMFGKESIPEYTPEQRECLIKAVIYLPE
jgi:hypothetical protein